LFKKTKDSNVVSPRFNQAFVIEEQPGLGKTFNQQHSILGVADFYFIEEECGYLSI
jgi:hypothetical protein